MNHLRRPLRRRLQFQRSKMFANDGTKLVPLNLSARRSRSVVSTHDGIRLRSNGFVMRHSLYGIVTGRRVPLCKPVDAGTTLRPRQGMILVIADASTDVDRVRHAYAHPEETAFAVFEVGPYSDVPLTMTMAFVVPAMGNGYVHA